MYKVKDIDVASPRESGGFLLVIDEPNSPFIIILAIALRQAFCIILRVGQSVRRSCNRWEVSVS